jgi:hypothetical protein
MTKLNAKEVEALVKILESRFEKNINRHPNVKWEQVLQKLLNQSEKIWTLNEMEKTGGEPDVVEYDEKANEYVFYDCSKETPFGRRNVCYDREALESRKKFKPDNSAVDVAKEIGIEILDEQEYRNLQKLGQFDLKTSSWIKTPLEIRKLGGAIFADRRYDTVFIYHNGADSYYGVRGFRGLLRV